MIGLGVAGNFTGHLEQAGEANDFADVVVTDEKAPKGLFPFYVPMQSEHFLAHYPLSSKEIIRPTDNANIQIEPEVALICDIEYENNKVKTITPRAFTAYNDCSIRKPAEKISLKKNWGPNTKGISDQLIPIDSFSPDGIMDSYRIACYILRDGILHPYGIDSNISNYSYFYQTLLDWITDKMNHQEEQGPLESISELLKASHYPEQTIISIGATRYTEFGEHTFLQKDDEIFVILYNESIHDIKSVEKSITHNEDLENDISILHQKVN